MRLTMDRQRESVCAKLAGRRVSGEERTKTDSNALSMLNIRQPMQ